MVNEEAQTWVREPLWCLWGSREQLCGPPRGVLGKPRRGAVRPRPRLERSRACGAQKAAGAPEDRARFCELLISSCDRSASVKFIIQENVTVAFLRLQCAAPEPV